MAEISNDYEGEVTIPVFVDSVNKSPDFQMARMTYFSVENDDPSPNWTLNFEGLRLPFFMVNLSGVIWRPDSDEPLFQSAERIEELFDRLDAFDDKGLYVDINDIWLPNSMLKEPFRRSDAYRISAGLFALALKYRNARIDLDEFKKGCEPLTDAVTFSEIESRAFKEWENRQITEVRDSFPKNPDLRLKRIRPSGR
jgi:hypothetical protein